MSRARPCRNVLQNGRNSSMYSSVRPAIAHPVWHARGGETSSPDSTSTLTALQPVCRARRWGPSRRSRVFPCGGIQGLAENVRRTIRLSQLLARVLAGPVHERREAAIAAQSILPRQVPRTTRLEPIVVPNQGHALVGGLAHRRETGVRTTRPGRRGKSPPLSRRDPPSAFGRRELRQVAPAPDSAR